MFQSRLTRRTLTVAGAASLLIMSQGLSAQEQEKFPSKPIEIVIHASYGGGTDVTARMMMLRTRRELGVDMVVNSQRGGGGAKAHEYAMGKPRDGYTVLALTQTHLYSIANGKSPLSIDDVVGVARAMDDPTFITVRADSPFKTLEDLVAASRDKPLNWGVAEIGSTEHIGLARFAKAAGGIKFKVVPFGSGGQMVQALMSGAIDATMPNVSEGGSQVNDGTFRALAVLAPKRLADFPDVPTAAEKGMPVNVSTTRGYFVLKGTPEDRIKILSDAMVKSMKHKVFANYLKSSGLSAEESVAGHEVWDKQIKEEYAQAAEALQELGVIKKK
ncbi:MAG: tripartite tricarboxylate transporter substrate binding protein [Gammaproteobacteria bacterium]|nr:tripartite tricarboxylate transporter substrate binding protein [Gammaproteobacteria bacterium]